jgi:hypothetical protein
MTSPAFIVRRYAECTAFVLFWIACGFYLRLSPIAFQLLGLPLIAGFQLAIARRPLAQLWVRGAEKFHLDRRTLAVAGVLFLVCFVLLFSGRGRVAAPNVRWQFSLLLAAAALPAAFALRRQRASDLRRALPFIVAALLLRVAWRVGWTPIWDGNYAFPLAKLPDFLVDALCEFVALFLVDEVAFRGALDPHLESSGTGRLHAWSSAVFGSILWAAWHFPAYYPHAKSFLRLFMEIGPISFIQIVLGPVLCFCARRSRTLVPSAAIHAVGNAYALTLMK